MVGRFHFLLFKRETVVGRSVGRSAVGRSVGRSRSVGPGRSVPVGVPIGRCRSVARSWSVGPGPGRSVLVGSGPVGRSVGQSVGRTVPVDRSRSVGPGRSVGRSRLVGRSVGLWSFVAIVVKGFDFRPQGLVLCYFHH